MLWRHYFSNTSCTHAHININIHLLLFTKLALQKKSNCLLLSTREIKPVKQELLI